jgi:hypothetical protein
MKPKERIIKLLEITNRPLSSYKIQMITNCWFISLKLIELETEGKIKYFEHEGYLLNGPTTQS